MDSADTETQPDAPEQEARPAPRWFQRVLPVTGLAVLLIGLAALVIPSFRDQVSLSLSRQSQPYVELYFARAATPTAQATCIRKGSAVLVRFVVASHLEDRQAVAYRVAVDPTTKRSKPQRRAGSARVTPGAAFEVRKVFNVPRKQGYTVSVRLPAFDQQLRAHCPGRRS